MERTIVLKQPNASFFLFIIDIFLRARVRHKFPQFRIIFTADFITRSGILYVIFVSSTQQLLQSPIKGAPLTVAVNVKLQGLKKSSSQHWLTNSRGIIHFPEQEWTIYKVGIEQLTGKAEW